MIENERLLTTSEVAALFGVQRLAVVRWAKAGRIACIRTPGNQYRFRQDEVASLLQDSRVTRNEN